ncbi:MAG: hypothetical protein LBS85_00285 [Clostridiales Family XIII bacterium]|nr:hypothetical protein [Clostridiales Family XIII bacterium]
MTVLILCIALAFGLAACGDKGGDTPSGDGMNSNTNTDPDNGDEDSVKSEGQEGAFPWFDEKTRVYTTGYGDYAEFSFVLPEEWEVTLDVFPQKGKNVTAHNEEDIGVTMQRLNTALDELVAKAEAGCG